MTFWIHLGFSLCIPKPQRWARIRRKWTLQNKIQQLIKEWHNQIEFTPEKQGWFKSRTSTKTPYSQRSICVPGSAKYIHWHEKEKNGKMNNMRQYLLQEDFLASTVVKAFGSSKNALADILVHYSCIISNKQHKEMTAEFLLRVPGCDWANSPSYMLSSLVHPKIL